jgi:hypothetical protein
MQEKRLNFNERNHMKRTITAVAFAVLAVPAFAFAADAGAPYDQNVIDRALPDVRNPVVADQPSASAGSTNTAVDAGAPYDQNVIDRALPDVRNAVAADEPSASAGPTQTGSSGWATGPWAQDPSFIAPAQ